MKKFNVVRAKKYQQNNEEKTAWLPVGTITEFDNGNQILELNNSSEQFNIFPFNNKKREPVVKEDNISIKTEEEGPMREESEEEIRVENIPF